MNQILENVKKEYTDLNQKKQKPFKYIFIFSIIIIIILFSIFLYDFYYKNKNEKISNYLQYNYNTIKLYKDQSNTYSNLENNSSYTENILIGEIEIPSLNISYPIFSILTDEALKVAPCIFHGTMPPESSNLCIAGHNYNNSQFFSLIYKLKSGDIINIYDSNNIKYSYTVFSNYEVKTDDLSPLLPKSDNLLDFHELTLITCNNYNNNRIIIKANY